MTDQEYDAIIARHGFSRGQVTIGILTDAERRTPAMQACLDELGVKPANPADYPEPEDALGDDEFDRRLDICTEVRDANGFNTNWCMFEDIATTASFDEVVSATPVTVTYDGGWGEDGEVTLAAPVKRIDLWRAANDLVVQSGDTHHCFIEALDEIAPGVLTLQTGS